MTVDVNDLLSVAEAAKRSPYSEPALRNRITRGEIPHYRIARNIYIRETDLRAVLGDQYRADVVR